MVNVQTNSLRNKVPFNALLDKVFSGEAASEPVTRQEAIDYCKLDTGTYEATIIDQLIVTAREQCEDFTGISFITRTVTALINNSNGGMFLPYCPFVSLTSIKDSDDNTIDSDNYKISGTQFPQLIYPAWDRLTLVYTAGYTSLPSRLKTAILQQVFYLNENRGESAERSRDGGTVVLTLSPQARATLNRVRRVSW